MNSKRALTIKRETKSDHNRAESISAMASPLLITGGAHSGKSELAVTCMRPDLEAVFIGTATATDGYFGKRLKQLADARPKTWSLVETVEDLPGLLSNQVAAGNPQILVDSLNLWLAARLVHDGERYSLEQMEDILTGEINDLCASVKTINQGESSTRLVLVTAEAGSSPSPTRPTERVFRRLVGLMNQKVAAHCRSVVLVTAGIPMVVKTTDGGSSH